MLLSTVFLEVSEWVYGNMMGWWVITITFLFFFNLDYYHDQLVSEKLGFLQESRLWSGCDSTEEEFLTDFDEWERFDAANLLCMSTGGEIQLTNQGIEENAED